jgi:hypothetical protein
MEVIMRWMVQGSVAIAVLLVGIAFSLTQIWSGLPLSILVGALWLAGDHTGRSWLAAVALVSLVLVTAVGGILGVSAALLLTAIALALFAWTMGNVSRPLTAVTDVRREPDLIKTHARWAGGIIGLGWLLGLIALNLQLTLTFGWGLLLGIVVVFTTSRFVRRLQREPGE